LRGHWSHFENGKLRLWNSREQELDEKGRELYVQVVLYLMSMWLLFTVSLPILCCLSGMHGVLFLRNHLNLATEFSWNPILGERGTAFSIRPATGSSSSFRCTRFELFYNRNYFAVKVWLIEGHCFSFLKLNNLHYKRFKLFC